MRTNLKSIRVASYEITLILVGMDGEISSEVGTAVILLAEGVGFSLRFELQIVCRRFPSLFT